MEAEDTETERSEPGAIEEAAGERLGVESWDRPLIFRDAADAAVDNGLSYWLVLLLSGAIATLGLAMNSAAVVIGAMLVAPLLGPIMGLSLALAVGDSRLALQSLAIVGGSILIVIATSAALTAILPFHTLTLEISSRIHPTTLDLGVAVCSGLVGALVTIGRGKRLSAAIPGVAVAVALIPPMSVAGFGMAAGWQTNVIWGALLLLGANLAGIVLSGVVVFLLIGMHRSDVVDAARHWHDHTTLGGLAAWMCRLPGVGRAQVFGSAPGRATLVLAFVAALAIPLTATLREVVREARVRGAVEEAIALLEEDGTTSVLWRNVELGPVSSVVRVRVATTVGVGAEMRDEFSRRATEIAGEPVTLRLEQLPAASGGASALEALLRGSGRDREEESTTWPETVARAREQLERAAWSLPFPEGAQAIGVVLHVEGGDTPIGADSVDVSYLAPEPLEAQTADVLGTVLRNAVGHPSLRTAFLHVGPARLEVQQADSSTIIALVALLRRYPSLRVALRSAGDTDSVATATVLDALRSAGVDSVDIERRDDNGPVELELRRARRDPGGE
jgi:uncharacterized hydrophobic protein (TIGR00271 family)